MIDYLGIPDFLLVKNRVPLPHSEPTTRTRITPQRQPRQRRWHGIPLPRSVEPAGLELLKQIEKEKEAKKKLRLAALKERRR